MKHSKLDSILSSLLSLVYWFSWALPIAVKNTQIINQNKQVNSKTMTQATPSHTPFAGRTFYTSGRPPCRWAETLPCSSGSRCWLEGWCQRCHWWRSLVSGAGSGKYPQSVRTSVGQDTAWTSSMVSGTLDGEAAWRVCPSASLVAWETFNYTENDLMKKLLLYDRKLKSSLFWHLWNTCDPCNVLWSDQLLTCTLSPGLHLSTRSLSRMTSTVRGSWPAGDFSGISWMDMVWWSLYTHRPNSVSSRLPWGRKGSHL